MTTPFRTFAFPQGANPSGVSSPALVNRTVITRYGEGINVKEYGALGNGSNIDTSSIQAAIDDAFGTTAKPNGNEPGGITGSSPPNPGKYFNKPLIFPPGHYMIDNTLTFPPIQGGRIYGAGSDVSVIECTVANKIMVSWPMMAYSSMEGLKLKNHAGTGTCLQIDNVEATDSAGFGIVVSTQANILAHMSYDGGAYGVVLSPNGAPMCSEHLMLNNHWANHTTGGLNCFGGNALQETVLGGSFRNCGIGCNVGSGSIPNILGVYFEGSTNRDIYASGLAAGDGHTIAGCRSTSPNFLHAETITSFNVIAVEHISATNGFFIENLGTPIAVRGCHSSKGAVYMIYGTRIKFQSCKFDRTDWYQVDLANHWGYAQELENVMAVGTLIKRQREQGDNVFHNYLVT